MRNSQRKTSWIVMVTCFLFILSSAFFYLAADGMKNDSLLVFEDVYQNLLEERENKNLSKDKYGGRTDVRSNGTGFFTKKKIDGKWWLLTPDGNSFLYLTATGMRYKGNGRNGGGAYSRYTEQKYGSKERWAEKFPELLNEIGLNAIGHWSDEILTAINYPYLYQLSISARANIITEGEVGLPEDAHYKVSDPYGEQFIQDVRDIVEEHVLPRAKDPYLIAWTTGNESDWAGYNRKGYQPFPILMSYVRMSPHRAGHAKAVEFLRDRYQDDFSAFEKVWATSAESFSDLFAQESVIAPIDLNVASKDSSEFLYQTVRLYSEIIAQEIRRVDINHLVIADRLGGIASTYEPIIRAFSQYFDILALNEYKQVLPIGTMEYYASLVDMPLVLSEHSMRHRGSTPKPTGAGAILSTAADRKLAVISNGRALFSSPYIVGMEWFKFIDIAPAVNHGNVYGGGSGILRTDGAVQSDLSDALIDIRKNFYDLHNGVKLPLDYSVRRAIIHPIRQFE